MLLSGETGEMPVRARRRKGQNCRPPYRKPHSGKSHWNKVCENTDVLRRPAGGAPSRNIRTTNFPQ